MGLWNGWFDGNRLGWDSPVTDGPIHPALVNLAAAGGLGWLDGFDELLARCGLENNGAPFEVKTVKPDGSESHTTFGLHGKIANIPASYVAVHVGAEPPHEIMVEGHVQESRLFGPAIRMETRITTTPGSNLLVVRDEFVNLKDQPVDMQVLYHWNFGPPFLDAGARFLAPSKSVTPATLGPNKGSASMKFTAVPSPAMPSRSITTISTRGRPVSVKLSPCSATTPATRRSCSGFTKTSFRRSPSGKTPADCATVM